MKRKNSILWKGCDKKRIKLHNFIFAQIIFPRSGVFFLNFLHQFEKLFYKIAFFIIIFQLIVC